jgi:ABC-type Zn uptake system ZnuABC Zn-binding protein ZnuA
MYMKTTKKMKRLLERMEKIECMERGKLCSMGERPHYNHQTWQDGRNAVRYVPAGEAGFVQDAIDGYALFKKLAEQYVDEVIRQTRTQQKRKLTKAKSAQKVKSRVAKTKLKNCQ